jgi:hypothetical protein
MSVSPRSRALGDEAVERGLVADGPCQRRIAVGIERDRQTVEPG